jgi:hypothetical protein
MYLLDPPQLILPHRCFNVQTNLQLRSRVTPDL